MIKQWEEHVRAMILTNKDDNYDELMTAKKDENQLYDFAVQTQDENKDGSDDTLGTWRLPAEKKRIATRDKSANGRNPATIHSTSGHLLSTERNDAKWTSKYPLY